MNKIKDSKLAKGSSLSAVLPINCPLGKVVYIDTKWDSMATYGTMRVAPHYLLVFTLEGEADYVDDTGVKAILKPGSLVWSIPGVAQNYGPRKNSRWSELFIWFSGPIFDTWQENGFPGSKTKIFHLQSVTYWLKRFQKLFNQGDGILSHDHVILICQFQQFLAEILHIHCSEGHKEEDLTWLKEASELLLKNIAGDKDLKGIAKSMNMSYSLFRKRFLKLSGRTPGDFKASEIIKQASVQLLETNDSIAYIAEKYGFFDQFHFSKRFKHYTDLSPSAFRQQKLK